MPAATPPLTAPTAAEKQAALRAILDSETFSRSEQLRSFLRFICEMEAAGRSAELTEYLIGVKALGRPESYSPLEDSSVRTRAYELRQRLQKFYDQEQPKAQPDLAVRIELPKGSYSPRYVAWTAPEPPSSPVVTEVASPLTLHRVIPFTAILAGAIIGTAATVAIMLAVGAQTARPSVDPNLRHAWAAITGQNPEVLICISTPLHMLVSPNIVSAPKYPAPPAIYDLFSRYRPLPSGAKLDMQPVQKAIPMGSVQGLARLLGVLQSLGIRSRILAETNSPLIAMRGRNVILIGSPWYSRATTTLLEKTPWTTALDAETKEVGLFGHGPVDGKKFLPKHSGSGEYQEVFGLLSVLSNGNTPDDHHVIVVLSGLTSAGTDGAAAFFSSPANLKDLANRFKTEGIRDWPRSYQVVVRCRSSADNQLLESAYESHLVIAR